MLSGVSIWELLKGLIAQNTLPNPLREISNTYHYLKILNDSLLNHTKFHICLINRSTVVRIYTLLGVVSLLKGE